MGTTVRFGLNLYSDQKIEGSKAETIKYVIKRIIDGELRIIKEAKVKRERITVRVPTQQYSELVKIAGKNKICEPPSPNLFRSSASLVAPCPISGSRPCRTTQTFSAGTANESMRVLRTYWLGVATAVARRKADGTRLRK